MIYDASNIDRAIFTDSPRRRYKLVFPVPTVADVTRAAYMSAIVQHVQWRFKKDGLGTIASFDPSALSADANGWYIVP